MKNKIILGVVAALIVIIVILGVTRSDRSVSGESIKVGGLYILSGPVASVGELQTNATVLALEKINSEGGINGRPLEIIQEDTAYDLKTSVSAYNSLKVRGIKYFLSDSSPVVAPVRPIVIEDGNFIIVGGPTTPLYNDNNNLSCRIGLTANQFGPAVAKYLFENGYKNVALLLQNNEYGVGMREKISSEFSKYGGKIISIEMYDSSASDYRTYITKINQNKANIDALFVVNASATPEPLFSQIKELGWDKPIFSDYYTIQSPNLKNLSLAEGVMFFDYEYSRGQRDADSSVTKEFKEAHKAKFGTDPLFLTAASYDIIMILAEGLRNADPEDPQSVADYISNMQNYSGVTGQISFDDDCEVSRDVFLRKVQNGVIVDSI